MCKINVQEDTKRNLEWLKEVKDSHGEVEVNAVSQASRVNARGIYNIGHLATIENRQRVRYDYIAFKIYDTY